MSGCTLFGRFSTPKEALILLCSKLFLTVAMVVSVSVMLPEKKELTISKHSNHTRISPSSTKCLSDAQESVESKNSKSVAHRHLGDQVTCQIQAIHSLFLLERICSVMVTMGLNKGVSAGGAFGSYLATQKIL